MSNFPEIEAFFGESEPRHLGVMLDAVHYWPMDEAANQDRADVLGVCEMLDEGRNLGVESGLFSRDGAHFDGGADWLSAVGSNFHGIGTVSDVDTTIEGWIWISVLPVSGNDYDGVWDQKESPDSSQNHGLSFTVTAGDLIVYWQLEKAPTGQKTRSVNCGTASGYVGKWTHLCMRIAGDGTTVELDVDDTVNDANSPASPGPWAHHGGAFNFGKAHDAGGGPWYLDGRMCNWVMYAGLLSNAEVTARYNAGAGQAFESFLGPFNADRLNVLSKRSQQVTSDKARTLYLPDFNDLVPGGPYFHIANTGSFTITVKDHLDYSLGAILAGAASVYWLRDYADPLNPISTTPWVAETKTRQTKGTAEEETRAQSICDAVASAPVAPTPPCQNADWILLPCGHSESDDEGPWTTNTNLVQYSTSFIGFTDINSEEHYARVMPWNRPIRGIFGAITVNSWMDINLPAGLKNCRVRSLPICGGLCTVFCHHTDACCGGDPDESGGDPVVGCCCSHCGPCTPSPCGHFRLAIFDTTQASNCR